MKEIIKAQKTEISLKTSLTPYIIKIYNIEERNCLV